MTREKQIKNYAITNCINDDIDDTSYKLIVEAAKWADETMIDKVCKLIEENVSYVCLHLGNYMEKEVDAKKLSKWIRKVVEE